VLSAVFCRSRAKDITLTFSADMPIWNAGGKPAEQAALSGASCNGFAIISSKYTSQIQATIAPQRFI
jgi:hypothetical protein